ncbi:probable G-protein coupled receptor 139 [Pristis pectinata]|uniref:probable G-protein coupled receptor 139 n=1 Tax=Pristis pectinata TaxID=685728 RepID=UPI00223E6113|nr:probable G-protein coupled receptor 139 [Pristis pectinata]
MEVKEIYYPVLATIGVPANLVAIVILSRGNCGLSKCSSVYMVGMASADLLVMIFNVTVCYIFTTQFPLSFLTRNPVCTFLIYMTAVTLDLSVWFTISFTFDRCVAICFRKLQTRYCTKTTATAVLTTLACLISLKNVPFFFAFNLQESGAVQWGCKANVQFLTSPFGSAFFKFHTAWVAWLPFTLIFLFNALTVRRILAASRSRKELRGHRGEKQADPELENRRKSIILLFAISGSFVLLWLTATVSFLATGLTNTNSYRVDRVDPAYVATEVGAMLKYLSSCPNTFIYAVTQRKFREQLTGAAKYLWNLILRPFRS